MPHQLQLVQSILNGDGEDRAGGGPKPARRIGAWRRTPPRSGPGRVFHDADSDALTISAASLDDGRVRASAQSDGSALTLTGVAPGWATVRVTAQDADGNRVSDAFNVQVIEAPAEPEAGGPPRVANLSCTATTERVAFRWDAPEWSGGELHDYDLTLPEGQRGQTKLVDSTSVSKSGDYQVGKEANISVKAVYKLDDGSKESSEASPLSCAVAG